MRRGDFRIRMKVCATAAAFSFFCALAFGQTAPTPPPSYKDLKYAPLKQIQIPKVEQYTLPSGLKVYLLENHELPLVRGLSWFARAICSILPIKSGSRP